MVQNVAMGEGSDMSKDPDRLLTPREVAAMFRVDPKTVTRWAQAEKLASVRTLGGHRRYRAADVEALLLGERPRATEVE